MNREISSKIFSNSNSIDKYANVKYVIYGERLDSADISIMIPTYKRPELLVRAVQSALRQKTNKSMEIVIVDNDPESLMTDIEKFLSSVNDSRVCYVQNEKNIGMFGNWNRCIEISHSEWIVILNDDDELEEEYVENMMESAISIDGSKVVCCRHHLIDESSNLINKKEKAVIQDKTIPILIKDMYLLQPVDIMGALLNRSFMYKLGGFNEDFYPCSDAVLLLRVCAEHGLFLNTKKLFRYRWAVNESQKPEVRIDFAKFQVQKSFEINKKYKLYENVINRFIINAKCDYYFYPLMKERIINEGNNRTIRYELGVDNKFYQMRRFIYRVIHRLYTNAINNRKAAIT